MSKCESAIGLSAVLLLAVGANGLSGWHWYISVVAWVVLAVGVIWQARWRRLAELDVAARRAHLEEASARQSLVLANVSHEIRTPLNGILGMTELLATDSELSEEGREQVAMLSRSARGLVAILNDVLDLSKMEAGKLQLHLEDFSLGALVRDIASLFAASALDKGLQVETVLPDAVDWVRADASRIRQILSNFTSNALKFTTEGGITIRVSAVPLDETRCELSFSVSDTGCGIPPEVCGKLFSPFTQADASTAGRHGGTGLGLAISKRLVEMMSGDIGVRSQPGQGATFWFTVPVSVAQVCAYQPAALAKAVGTVAGTRILVAEDTLVNQRVVERLLLRLGCVVEIVGDGEAALEAIQRSTFDLVLMDCHMPKMDGLEATRSIRALAGAVGRIPIVALTASADDRDRERCLEVGMSDFLTKPFRADELVAMVERCRNADQAGALRGAPR